MSYLESSNFLFYMPLNVVELTFGSKTYITDLSTFSLHPNPFNGTWRKKVRKCWILRILVDNHVPAIFITGYPEISKEKWNDKESNIQKLNVEFLLRRLFTYSCCIYLITKGSFLSMLVPSPGFPCLS